MQPHPEMTEKDAIKILQELEERFDLLQYQVDGWCLWPLLRFDVVMNMVHLSLTPRARFTRFQQLMIALKDLPALMKLPRREVVVKTYSSARSSEENGLMKDVFFDDLLEGCEPAFRIEGVNHRGMFQNRGKAKTRTDITSLPVEITAGVLAMLPGISPDFSEAAENISRVLIEDLNLPGFTAKRVLRKARFFYWAKKIYLRLLKRLGAKKVLTADPAEFLIAAAAKEMGLPVIEFQHGLVSCEYNTTYGWDANARKHKKKMPLSDRILLFGDYWKDVMLASKFWDEEMRVTGRAVLDSFRTPAFESEDDCCRIVFTSQGLETDKLLRMVHEFLTLAEGARFDYHLTIKLHPVYDPNKQVYLTELANSSRVTVLEADEEPSTFELLSTADVHWTISSSCHYDALGLGVPTVILGLQTYEMVLPLYEDGFASLARDGRELFEIVKKWREFSVPESVSAHFYRPGALENARKEIGLR